MKKLGWVIIDEKYAKPFTIGLAHERRLLLELIERDPDAAWRLSSMMFSLRVNRPQISELQTTLWTA